MASALAAVKTSIHPTEIALPKRLLDFFARYPPRLYSAYFTGQKILSLQARIAIQGNKKTGTLPLQPVNPTTTNPESSPSEPEQPNVKITSPSVVIDMTSQTPEQQESIASSGPLEPDTQEPMFESNPEQLPPNPFLPYKNPATGRWRGPHISLRRQAELFKLARLFGVEPLLPPSRKSTVFKEERLLQRTLGPNVRGTGEGQKVKGHKWEREMGVVLGKRIKAMEMMPELIREWRMRGNGRGWKKYPR